MFTPPNRFESRDPMMLGGIRRRHEFSNAGPGITQQWLDFREMEELPGQVGNVCYGVMCGADETGFEYMCAYQVRALGPLPEGTGKMRVPAQDYAIYSHEGNASTLAGTWKLAFDWLKLGDHVSAHKPDFEVYPEGEDALSAPEGIEIWLGVLPRPKDDEAEESEGEGIAGG